VKDSNSRKGREREREERVLVVSGAVCEHEKGGVFAEEEKEAGRPTF
jgi:hypothetical protein